MRISVLVLLIGSWILMACVQTGNSKEVSTPTSVTQYYKCLPCGYDCDTLRFDQPGECPHCKMAKVKAETIRHGNLSASSLCMSTEKNLIFLDVRTPEEFNGTAEEKFGAIKGAINIPVQELEKRIKELEPYKDKKIIVYCSHSHRSPRASYMLTQQGFQQVYNLEGGMSIWQEQVKDPDCNRRLYQNQQ